MSTAIDSREKWILFGSPNPEIIFAGHSHTFAIYSALNKFPQFQNFFAVVAQADYSQHQVQDSEYWEFVRASSKKAKKTAIIWNGNQHNIHFLLDSGFPFNFFGANLDRNFPTVPISQIRALFNPTFDELKTVILQFPKSSKILLLETPAPKPKSFLDARITSDKDFLNIAKNLGLNLSDLKASSDELRVALWKINQQITAEIAESFSYPLISVPESSVTELGTLREDFCGDDLTHANFKYGKLLLNKCLDVLGIKIEKI